MGYAAETKGPANIDKILASTLSIYRKKMSDNIYTALPVIKRLIKQNKKKEQSGASIIMPLSYRKNTTSKWYARYDTLDTTPQDNMTSAQYKWKQLAGAVTIAGIDLRVNKGESQIVNLLEAEINNCEMALIDKLGTALFAATQDPLAINTLVLLVDATSSIADVNSTTYDWWQATVTASGSFAGQGLPDMRTMYNTLSKYNRQDTPDMLVTTQTINEYYENKLDVIHRIVDTKNADLGFPSDALQFKGAKIIWDENATSGVIYFLNSRHLELVVHADADFQNMPFVQAINQDAKTSQILSQLELCTDERRKHGKLTGISA